MEAAGASLSENNANSSNATSMTAAVVAALAHTQSIQTHPLTAATAATTTTTSGSDIDSLLAANANANANAHANDTSDSNIMAAAVASPLLLPPPPPQKKRVFEPYERHRAHDLRAECYHRGLRPIKKGPHANDNKGGYVNLLRQDDSACGTNGTTHRSDASDSNNSTDHRHQQHQQQLQLGSAAKKRKLPSSGASSNVGTLQSLQLFQSSLSHEHPLLVPLRSTSVTASSSNPPSPTSRTSAADNDAAATSSSSSAAIDTVTSTAVAAADLTSFYVHSQASPIATAPSLPQAQAPTNGTAPPPPTTTTDLEILSGIANTYTTQQHMPPHSDVVKPLLQAPVVSQSQQSPSPPIQHCSNCSVASVAPDTATSTRTDALEQRERDTIHLQHVFQTLAALRQQLRTVSSNDRVLQAELIDDIAFFVALKETTKRRMRHAMLRMEANDNDDATRATTAQQSSRESRESRSGTHSHGGGGGGGGGA